MTATGRRSEGASPSDLLTERAALRPLDGAIGVDGGEVLTYGDWERRSLAQAHGLRREGVRSGATVMLVYDSARWTDYAVAYIAVQRAGGIAVPLSAALSGVELARVARAVEAQLVLAPAARLDRPAAYPPTIDPRELEDATGGEPLDRGHVPASSVCEILCTSRPLADVVLHPRTAGDVLDAGGSRELCARLPARGGGALLHTEPVGSRAGQAGLVAAVWDRSLPSIAVPSFDAERIAELIAAGSVRVCALHPALALALLESGVLDRPDVEELDAFVLSSGAAPPGLTERLRRAFPRAAIVEAGPPVLPDVAAGGDLQRRPVSTAQEGMLWHEVFAPGCQNLQGLARRYRGPLDVHALRRALREIVRRHRPLRTTFELRHGRLLQTVHPHESFDLAVRDLTGVPPGEVDAHVERFVADAGRRPFDLATGPLFETTLLRLAADDHVLVIRTHHTVFDDRSVGIFRSELAALYTAGVEGRDPALPEVARAFDEVAARQRETLAGPEGERQLAFWRRELAGAPLTTQLAVVDPALPPGTPHPAAAPIGLALPRACAAAVRDLARRERATVFMTMLAAFGVLVGRATGQDDLLLSTIVANRNRAELHGIIGCFSKKVPLRLRLDGDPTFREVLARIRRALLGTLSAQDLPFEALVDEVLGPDAARHGLVPHPAVLFQAVTRGPRLTLPDLESTGFETSRRATIAHFMAAPGGRPARTADIPWGAGVYLGTFVNVSLDDGGDDISLTARGAFDAPAMRLLLDDLADLVAAVAAEPEKRLGDLDVPSRFARPAAPAETADLRGFRVEPARIEETLRSCPGVRAARVVLEAAGGEPSLRTEVVADPAPLTEAHLRTWLWSRLPGYPWPSAIRIAPEAEASAGPALEPAPGGASRPLPGGDGTSEATLLAALHAGAMDGGVAPAHYWQSFSFLEALSVARDAGVTIPAGLVSRNRTVAALATALAAQPRRRG